MGAIFYAVYLYFGRSPVKVRIDHSLNYAIPSPELSTTPIYSASFTFICVLSRDGWDWYTV